MTGNTATGHGGRVVLPPAAMEPGRDDREHAQEKSPRQSRGPWPRWSPVAMTGNTPCTTT
mgnify:CR=1 FL=1